MTVLSKNTIKLSDVTATLATAENRTVTTLAEASVLTTENMKWNIYKPVNWDTPTVDRSNDNWTKGKDGHYGITAPSGSKNATTLINKFTTDGKNGWGYVSKNRPYRLADFRGFDTDVKAPSLNYNLETAYYDGLLYFSFPKAITSVNALTPIDVINTYSSDTTTYDAKFGLLFKDRTSGLYYITTNTSVRNASPLVTGRAYDIYPILSPNTYNSITAFNDTYDVDFFPYPSAKRVMNVMIYAKSKITTISCANKALGSLALLNPRFNFSTSDAERVSVKINYVYKRKKTSTTGSTLVSGESVMTGYNDTVVSSGTSKYTEYMWTRDQPFADYSTYNVEIYATTTFYKTVAGVERSVSSSATYRVNVTPMQST